MDELIPLAMAGSQRRGTPLAAPLFQGLDGAPETRLLGAAALAGVAALAGLKPRSGPALDTDPENDARAVAATRHLQLILDGDYRDVLNEWLELAQQCRKRVDPGWLPRLLEVAAQDRSLRESVAVVGGPRALWLARQNPEWSFLLGQAEEENVWETATGTVRMDWLAGLRGRDPALALQLLRADWAQESADERQKALQALANGLSMADEEFLEEALDDRSKGVRSQAAELLARLPGSRLAQRARTRMAAWAEWKTTSAWLGLRKTQTLEVNPPAECTREMQRDGIEVKPPRGVGEKAWWLQQAVAQTPLDFWPAEPAQLLKAAGDWSEALEKGWLRAARAQRQAAWAAALIEAGARDEELFAILPHAQQEELLLQHWEPAWLVRHRPYSRRLAAALIPALQARQPKGYDWSWAQLLRQVALLLPPDTPVEEGWAVLDSAVEKLIATVNFRQSMNREMQQ